MITKKPTQSELNNRSHTCCNKEFGSHDAFKFHAMREHFLREHMIGKCIVKCEMLTKVK